MPKSEIVVEYSREEINQILTEVAKKAVNAGAGGRSVEFIGEANEGGVKVTGARVHLQLNVKG